ncbi:hypothetical protein ACJRO7_029631 [Eucalyptus globulus]|uniref:DUF4220 domain-containing protein n=1 Tax=Eucalyptus globulus TaxID=34317 RepID=A0ABD3JAM5_EUCGL
MKERRREKGGIFGEKSGVRERGISERQRERDRGEASERERERASANASVAREPRPTTSIGQRPRAEPGSAERVDKMEITKNLAEVQKLWMKINLRGAILTSLSLQVFLIFLAPIRKRRSNRWISSLLWLAYLVADWVAVYAFGLISKAQINGGTSNSQVDISGDISGDLLAFWASNLVLHLGGPDTITAIGLEDNELWGRHMLGLLLHLGIACFVIYQSLPNNKLIVPSILMFIGGSIKYVARIRTLYLASNRIFRGSLLPSPDPGPNYAKIMEENNAQGEANVQPSMASLPKARHHSRHEGAERENILDDRTVIKEAYFYFKMFQGLLVDLTFSSHVRDNSMRFFSSKSAKDAFRIIEAELNFFYDLLYTRAAIVHCPSGYIYRAISVGCIVAAFARFIVLNKHGFYRYDIQITYTLLLVAVGLEFAIIGMIICSDWTIAKIGTSEKHHRSLFQGSIFIELLLKFKSESSPFALHILSDRWSKSISQYNLIDSRLRRWPKWIEKLIDARQRKWPRLIEEPLSLIPLRELCDDLKSGRVEPYNDALGELIFDELKRKASMAGDLQCITGMCAARGKWALEHTKTGKVCEILLQAICDVDYSESLLLWHIATELCYNTDTDTDIDESTKHHRETSRVLSNYMLYLMIKQPRMMSMMTGIGQIRFQDTCAEADRFFDEKLFDENKTNKYACQCLLSIPTDLKPADVKGDKSKSALFDACILAKKLGDFGETKWVILSEVWVELLGYTAIHCQPYNHAQQLSEGGELVTLVWLLMVHLGLSKQFHI